MAKRIASAPPVLAGYNYIRPLGSGGFADVFLYEQDMPHRVAAVKVLFADAVNPEVYRTFNIEADVMARLSGHPSIVTIYQASISADGRPYFAMEYCPDTMSARYKKDPLTLASVLDTGVRIAGALETAHRAGLLHRDIKPSNILVTSLAMPVLADFGIAAALSDEDNSDVFAMSIPWSAPEVLQERVTGSIPSEVWGFGATLYTLLAGHSPFELPTREKNNREALTSRVIKASYTKLPNVPDGVNEILAMAMEKDPSKRFASMADFGERLRQAQSDLGFALTTLEVASQEWAAASPVNFADDAPRGPVIPTVKKDSRRAARAQKQQEQQVPLDRDGLPMASVRSSSLRAGLIGAGLGAAALAAIVTIILFSTGTL